MKKCLVRGCLLLLLLLGLTTWLVRAQVPAWQTALTTNSQSPGGNSVVNATAADAAGNVYLAGSFTGTVAFGGTVLTNSGSYNTFVAKWSVASNSFAWVRQGTSPADGYSAALAVVVQGSSLYVAGSFSGATLSFGGVTLSNAGTQYRDLYVLKLTDTGSAATVGWGWQAGGSRDDEALGLACIGSQLYVAGYFSAGATFGGTVPANRGAYDAFVARLTDGGSSASFGWVQAAGGPSNDEATAIVATGSTLYIAGFFIGTAAFGPASLSSAGSSDAYVARLTDAGPGAGFDWVRQAGGPELDAAQGLALGSGGLYLTGATQSPVAAFGGVTLASATTPGGFVAKLTEGSNPAFTWAVPMGGLGTAIQVSGSQVYVAGFFGTGTLPPMMTAAAFGNTTLTSYGAWDAFVVRVADAGPSARIAWALQAGSQDNDRAHALTVSAARVYVGGVFNGSPMQVGSLALTKSPGSPAALFLASLADPVLPTRAATDLPGLGIFPSPAHGTATVRVPAGAGPATLEVVNAVGQVVCRQAAPAGQDATLRLVGLIPGVYAVRVQLGDEAATRRLVVE